MNELLDTILAKEEVRALVRTREQLPPLLRPKLSAPFLISLPEEWHSSTYRHHVTRATVFGFDRSEDVIEQSSRVKLCILDIGTNCEETSSHLQHVIHVARFVRPSIDAFRQLIRWSKVFVFAVSAGGVRVIVDYCVPEKLGRRAVRLLARVDVLHQRAAHFLNLRVAVLTRQFIFAAFQRVRKRLMIETL